MPGSEVSVRAIPDEGFGFLEWMIIIGFLAFLSIAEFHPIDVAP